MLFCYFSNSPFTSAFRLCFLFNHATLGLRPFPRFCLHSSHNLFFIVPFRSQLLCREPLTSFFNDVLDSICSRAKTTSTTYKSNLKDKTEIKGGKTTMQLLGWAATKKWLDTCWKGLKNYSGFNQRNSKTRKYEECQQPVKVYNGRKIKHTVTINQGNPKNRELQRT